MARNPNRLLRIAGVAFLAVGALLLAGCPPRETIASINRDPGRYHGHEIAVAGRVVNSFGIMGEGAFEIDDGTGRLWVVSERYGIPGRNARVAVVGRLQQGLSIGGRNFAMVLRETRRRHEG